MSLSVPQNGVKGASEPVIELFVKVGPAEEGFYHTKLFISFAVLFQIRILLRLTL